MIPRNIKTVRKGEPLTTDKVSELIRMNPSWILMGIKEILVFFVDRNVVGAYPIAGCAISEIMDACDKLGYNKYHGYWPTLHKRGMKAVGVPNVIAALEGKSSAQITYMAKDGEVTIRTVRNWRIADGKMVAFCEKADAERTFFLHSIYGIDRMEEEEKENPPKIEEEELHCEVAETMEELSKAKWLKEASETIEQLEKQLAKLKEELAKHAAV